MRSGYWATRRGIAGRSRLPNRAPATDHGQPEETSSDTRRGALSRGIDISINPSRILRVLLFVIAVIVILSTAGQVMAYNMPDFPLRDGIANLFLVSREQSVGTLYSLTMWIAGALLAWAIAHAHRRGGEASWRHWAALSFLFVLLAIDEQGNLHEQSTEYIRSALNVTGGPLWYTWVVPALAFIAAIAIAFLRFVRHLPRFTRHRMLLASLLFLAGAIGLEMLGGWYSSMHGERNPVWVALATLEETLEMVGLTVFVYALLTYIPVGLPDAAWRLQIRSPR